MSLSQAQIIERDVITKLLIQYKEHPCLWDQKHVNYSNKVHRRRAQAVLLETYKLFVKDASTFTLARKIAQLRDSYCREHKKMLQNKKDTPTLWYYDLLSFLHEAEDSNASIADKYSQSESEINADEEFSGANVYLDFQYQSADDIKSEPPDFQPTRAKKTKLSYVDLEPDQSSQSFAFRSDESEAEVFGRALGMQLYGLSSIQKTIAQKLISEVIYYGRLEKLTTQTAFINLCDD